MTSAFTRDTIKIISKENEMNLDRIFYLKQIEATNYVLCNYIQYLDTEDGELLESRRVEICSWMYRFVDSYDLCRNLVSSAMYYFDRSLMTILAREDCEALQYPVRVVKSSFLQLASLTALNIAIKIYSPLKWNMNHMIKCSRGKFNLTELIDMERQMLHILFWRVNPPTSSDFVMILVSLLFDRVGRSQLEFFFNNIVDVATFFTELSVWDSYFLEHEPSTVAIASILISMESIENDEKFDNIPSSTSFIIMLQALDLLPNEETVYHVCSRLQYAYSRSDDNQEVTCDIVIEQPLIDERVNSRTNVIHDSGSNIKNLNTSLIA